MNHKPALPTKVTPPNLTDVFPRKKVFDLLEGSGKRPIIWVSGPPGSGKTTLIGSYIERLKEPCLWFNLDEGDADPATLFYYLGLAANRAVPRSRKPLPVLTPEYLSGIATFTRRFFENLCRRLKSPSVIVFDNYHNIPEDASIHSVIQTALSALSPGIRIVFISRNQPHAAFARHKANRKMQTIGWDQLCFSMAETRKLLQSATDKRLSAKTLGELHRITNGWVAGLVLMLESDKRQTYTIGRLNAMTREDIFNYFANEIFDRTKEGVQEFLIKSSLLTEMTSEMAKSLTDNKSAARILSQLYRTHYFTEKRSQQRRYIYQYHPLFREFLLAKAANSLSSEEMASLRYRAATLLEQADQNESAITLYQQNANWQEMSQLIMTHGPDLLKQGRNLVLEKWLGGVPREILHANPWLSYWKGMSCFPLKIAESQACLEQAFEQFKAQQDTTGIFLSWAGIVDAIAFGFEDLKPLDRWIHELENMLTEYEQLPSAEIKARVTSCMFIALFLRQPHHAGIESWAQKALAESRLDLDENVKALSLFILAQHTMLNGQMDQVAATLYDMNALADTSNATPLTRLRVKFAETVYYQANELYPECLKAMNDGLAISKKTGVHILDAFLMMYGIAGALNRSDVKMAEQLLEQMSAFLDRLTSWERVVHQFTIARLAMLRGDHEQAAIHMKVSLENADKVGVPQKFCIALLFDAQVNHALHKFEKASENLEQVLRMARQTNSRLFEFWARMMKAQFAYQRGRPDEGLESLRAALTIGKAQRYMNSFIDQPAETANLCAKALEADIEPEYVQELVRRRRLILEPPPIHLESWPWAVKIYTLGRFGLVRDGKPVRFAGKAQEKPLALIKVLIALGGREVHEEQIADALWPEADGDKAYNSFKTTLWRLRKLIGFSDVIQVSDKKLTLDAKYCWTDVWAFERILRRADTLWQEELSTNDMTEAVSLVQKALDFYKGPFLTAETNASWAISLRERLQNWFLRTVNRLCKLWQANGQHEKAIECFQRSLEVDDLAEDLYQQMMTCYSVMGRRADGLSLYERYKTTLHAKLGAEPSLETETLCKVLFSNDGPMK